MRFDYSAGGIVVDGDGRIAVIRTSNLKGEMVWGLPKGHPKKDESGKSAALREVAEETGLEVECDTELPATSVQYWFVDKGGERVKKQVDFWLMRATGGDVRNHDDEVTEVALLAAAQAVERLTYGNEKKAVEAVLAGP